MKELKLKPNTFYKLLTEWRIKEGLCNMGKRANGEGCIRKKKKSGYWEAIITVGYDNNGRQLSQIFYCKNTKSCS